MHRTILTTILAIAGALTALAAPAPGILSLTCVENDSTIVYPESFETDTHRMMQNWYLQTYTELDKEVDSRPDVEVSDDELIRRLSTMPTIVEMPFNSIVRSYINMYTGRKRGLVENMLGMSLYYMPIFETALEREGVPNELKYLPVIESALNPDAVSRAGATGLWQFMLPTARGLGLEVNTLVDERRDPVRSSEMAARYLHQLHDIYNDWSLAIAAYNCGPGNINKALRRAGSSDSDKKDFWAIYPFLPAETRGYLPCFIAATYVMNYYDRHNISPALAKRPILTDSVMVGRRVHFQQIADVLNIPVEEIAILNPQYRQQFIPGDIKPYPLVLPSQQIYSYIMSEDAIVAHNADFYARRMTVEPADGTTNVRDEGDYTVTETVKLHKVKKGETLTSIARRYGVSVSSIKKTNGVKKAVRGKTLKIITVERVRKPQEPPTPAAAPDSLLIALEQAPEVAPEDAPASDFEDGAAVPDIVDEEEALVDAEPAMTDPAAEPAPAVEAPAQKAPAPKAAEAKAPAPKFHTVRSGDTLNKIARRYGTTVARLQKLNSIQGSNIKIGQKIRVN